MQGNFLSGLVLSFFIFAVIMSFFLFKKTKKKRWIAVMLCSQFFSVVFVVMGWPSPPSDEAYRQVLRHIEMQENRPSAFTT
jgi:hypothetical membrane protein